MSELLQNPAVRWALWMGLLLALTIVAAVIVQRVRQEAVQDEQQEQTAGDLLTKFREMHSQGGLTDEEFRTIKTKLAARFQEELKDNDETG